VRRSNKNGLRMHTRTHTHICIHTSMPTHTYTHQTHTDTHIKHTRTHTRHTQTHTHQPHTHTHKHTHTPTTHTHTHTHTKHTHARTQAHTHLLALVCNCLMQSAALSAAALNLAACLCTSTGALFCQPFCSECISTICSVPI